MGGLNDTGVLAIANLTQGDVSQLGLMDSSMAHLSQVFPSTPVDGPGPELAEWSDVAPHLGDLDRLLPFSSPSVSSMSLFYQGQYLGWNDFLSSYHFNNPGLWIQSSYGWSWYASMPLGSWAMQLLYVPVPGPIAYYEIYPAGWALKYDMGSASPGYYYLWYYADSPGRHMCIFSGSNGFSNPVVIDIYQRVIPPRPTPGPKERCERNPQCTWANGQCYCRGLIEDPEKVKCEQNPQCDWVNGHCYCRGLIDDPQKVQCEQNPQCSWANGQCYCRGLIDPEKERCEQNPMCSYVNGQCLCTGLLPSEPEPMPEPVGPSDGSGSAREQCVSDPSCHWVNGQCLCMGLGGMADQGQSGDDENGDHLLGATE